MNENNKWMEYGAGKAEDSITAGPGEDPWMDTPRQYHPPDIDGIKDMYGGAHAIIDNEEPE